LIEKTFKDIMQFKIFNFKDSKVNFAKIIEVIYGVKSEQRVHHEERNVTSGV
jgi:hypothetical protein